MSSDRSVFNPGSFAEPCANAVAPGCAVTNGLCLHLGGLNLDYVWVRHDARLLVHLNAAVLTATVPFGVSGDTAALRETLGSSNGQPE